VNLKRLNEIGTIMSNKGTYDDQISDVRAEVIVAMLLREKNIKSDQLVVSNKGVHKRSFSNDIHRIDENHFMSGGYQFLVQLNRDGIYDVIPEAFFHPSRNNEKGSNQARVMSEQYKRRRNEEKEARDFFAPIENEFFLQRVNIENTEVQALSKLHQYDLSLPFFGLNSRDKLMPDYLCRKWAALLPYVSEITGNMEYLKQCAEFFLEQKVELVNRPSKISQKDFDSSKMGSSILGEDMLLGDCFNACFKHIELLVKEIPSSKALLYIPGQAYARFIDIFIEVFTPLNVDFTWRAEVLNTEPWTLGEDACRLSFTTTI